MKPSRTRFKSFIGDTLDYREAPKQLDPVRLDFLVTQLRMGDSSVEHEIVLGHLHLVMGIIGDIPRAKKCLDDSIGAAMLALASAVHDAAERLYDNNITAYITEDVKYAVKECIAAQHVIRVPSRTIRDKISKGEQFGDIVPGMQDIREDSPEYGNTIANGDEAVPRSRGQTNTPYFIPIAKEIEPSIEFKEALDKTPVLPIERLILELRAQDYGYEEIGAKVGYGKSMVGKIVAKLEARFDELYK